MTLIMAHRGSSGTHPENTLPAFMEAIRVGADGIELDVHLTKDQQLVVIHDEAVDRTTNGTGLVRELTLAELKELDAGSWFGKEYRWTKIPTLREVLDLLVQMEFHGCVNIELKTDHFPYPNMEAAVSKMMTSEHWTFSYGYSSFNMDSLVRMHELEPAAQLDIIMKDFQKKAELAQDLAYIEGLHPSYEWVEKQVSSLENFPKALRPWTVNSYQAMMNCFEWGLAAIITDFPEKAERLKNRLV